MVSTSDDPTQGWFLYQLTTGNSSGNCPDFPRVGQDKQAIYLASNVFSGCASYLFEEWLALPKAAMEAGQSFTFSYLFNLHNPDGSISFTSQPANVFDPYDNPRAEFFVESTWSGGHTLTVWALSNPLVVSGTPGPELSELSIPTVNPYTIPALANQPGGAHSIDTNDARISGEVTYNSGVLFAALTTNSSVGTPATIMYMILPSLNDGNVARCTGSFTYDCADLTFATVINEMCFACGGFTDPGGGAYFGTMQPDPEGNWTMVYNYSSNAAYASLAYLSNRITKKPGTIRDSGFIAAGGSHFYNQGRWGDYTAVAPAGLLSNANGVNWFAGMFAGSDGNWATVIGKNAFTAINQP